MKKSEDYSALNIPITESAMNKDRTKESQRNFHIPLSQSFTAVHKHISALCDISLHYHEHTWWFLHTHTSSCCHEYSQGHPNTHWCILVTIVDSYSEAILMYMHGFLC